jgi:hypothetical protein
MTAGTRKSELSAARLALVSDVPLARRAQSENTILRRENERLQTENERLRVENMHLTNIGAKLGAMNVELKKENVLLTKENVDLCARLNRPAFMMPRKGRLPPRKEEEGVRVVELDDEPVPAPEPEASVTGHGGQKLVRLLKNRKASSR